MLHPRNKYFAALFDAKCPETTHRGAESRDRRTDGPASQARRSGEDSPGGTYPVCPVNGSDVLLAPHKWRGVVVAATQQFVSASGISGTVYLPMCSYVCGKNVEYREWNEATRDTGRV